MFLNYSNDELQFDVNFYITAEGHCTFILKVTSTALSAMLHINGNLITSHVPSSFIWIANLHFIHSILNLFQMRIVLWNCLHGFKWNYDIYEFIVYIEKEIINVFPNTSERWYFICGELCFVALEDSTFFKNLKILGNCFLLLCKYKCSINILFWLLILEYFQ